MGGRYQQIFDGQMRYRVQDDDLFLELNRNGFIEEAHFTVAYSPVRGLL